MLNRHGSTVIELLVAVILGAIVLGAATSSVLHQQRSHERINSVSGSDLQLTAATMVLASQLSFLQPASGDISTGEARDTSIQFRATIASSLACDRTAGSVTFLPDSAVAAPLSGLASLPKAGDSLWYLGDSTWTGLRVEGVSQGDASCPAPFAASGATTRLALAGSPDTIPAGAPLRVTRQTRYAFYRSGDGTWQLGFREWSDATGSFAAPQPVAGPVVRQADGRRSRFRYFDSQGTELGSEGGFEARVARVRVITHALTATRDRGQDTVRSDSLDIALHHATPL